MKIALVGNQNSGKTTLFNLLTGTNQKVGNWPGVTIERKEGRIKGTDCTVVDLPGIYSLSPYTSEEEVSRKYVVEENPDLIINIIDATSIERSLYLTTQLLELDSNVMIVLNMCDMLEKRGMTIDTEELSKNLSATVVRISALKKTGIDDLINHITHNDFKENPHQKIFDEAIEKAIANISDSIEHEDTRFIAIKLLERDIMLQSLHNETIEKEIKNLEAKYQTDTEQIIANGRYDYIVSIKEKSFISHEQKESMTDKLDKIFLNHYASLPIFVGIMCLIYYLSVGVVGSATVDLVENTISMFSDWIRGLLIQVDTSLWLVSLICDGIIAGVGAMLNFVPQLIILFICIAILETSGYMSRIAFILDRVFKKFGLSGKSLIPFIVGSGCSVPGIMTARTVEDPDERKMTIMLTPFIPCSAKLPIIVLFSSYFFDNSGLISVSLYFMAIVIILLSALVLKKFFYKGEASTFISELPEYKLPSPRYVFRDVVEKVWAFIKRAGTVILLCSIIIWVLLSFTWRFEYIESSWNELDNYSLLDIAQDNNVVIDEDDACIIRFNDDNLLEVSFGINEEGKTTYTDFFVITPQIHYDDLKNSVNEQDQRKTIIVQTSGDKILYSSSLTIENSILASIGNVFSWVFYPILGELNWAATVSAIQGLVAKEQVVGSMSVIAGFSDEVESGTLIFSSKIFRNFTAASAYSFMVFNLFSAPCIGAVGAMRRELGSTKRLLITVLFQTAVAWVLASLLFGILTLFGV